jgi:hypothetical protein
MFINLSFYRPSFRSLPDGTRHPKHHRHHRIVGHTPTNMLALLQALRPTSIPMDNNKMVGKTPWKWKLNKS